MRLILSLAALIVASPAAAERITTYWQLEPTMPTGTQTAALDKPAFAQRILPVKLVRLTQPALPAGGKEPVAAGTLLYLVVNAAGKSGYCTIKDRSGKSQAKSLFIPVLDQRPCFSDRDGDGKFDASFSVFEAYTTLSPPQARGSIDAAKPIDATAGYEQVDVHLFPVAMTISYRLLIGKTPPKNRVRMTLDRPGHSDYLDLRGAIAGERTIHTAPGADIVINSANAAGAEIEILALPEAYIYAVDNGTIFLPKLPDLPALK